MKSVSCLVVELVFSLLCAAGSAYASQPPDVVSSDGSANTAMGTQALQMIVTGGGASDNTAAGFYALNGNTTGLYNTAMGSYALNKNTTAGNNGAFGVSALQDNTTGSDNDAFGYQALLSNTTGNENFASGSYALYANTTGAANIAVGFSALIGNTTGAGNVAIGVNALPANSTGSNNTAVGTTALFSATTASGNTATGASALYGNSTGYNNNAMGSSSLYNNSSGYYNNGVGYYALYANTVGYNNNAQGSYALSANTTGYGNSAMGANSLLNLTTGFRNVGVGNNTGTSLVAGNYNVDIGWGVTGSGDETGVIRIGNPTYATATYVAGVSGTVVTGAAVYVTASGRLGVLASSERYKKDIASLPANIEKLEALRPVSFHLKTDPKGTLQYGLIAEEVNQVYPELVIRDEQGQIQGVRYDELAPLLLSEVQEQRRTIGGLQQQLAVQDERFAVLERQDALRASELDDVRQQLADVQQLKVAMQAALARLQYDDSQLAKR